MGRFKDDSVSIAQLGEAKAHQRRATRVSKIFEEDGIPLIGDVTG